MSAKKQQRIDAKIPSTQTSYFTPKLQTPRGKKKETPCNAIIHTPKRLVYTHLVLPIPTFRKQTPNLLDQILHLERFTYDIIHTRLPHAIRLRLPHVRADA
jgi:hypothetical protein